MKLTPIVAAALVAGALAAPASQASSPLHCGATITKSTKLTQDLANCHGVGLRIVQGNAATVAAPDGAVDRGA